MESPFEALSPPHEVSTAYFEKEDYLSDLIKMIGRINLGETLSYLVEKHRPYQIGPQKWFTKTLESVYFTEFGKTITISPLDKIKVM